MSTIALLALILVGIAFFSTMIDISTEHVLTLSQAAKELPERRKGRKPHVSCMYRWTISGCRGIILDSIQIGGTRCTSREAIQRFAEALSHKRETGEPAPATRSVIQRTRASEAAANELKKLGV